MITALLMVAVVLDLIGLWFLWDNRIVKREIMSLLRVNKEWVEHQKSIRRDVAVKADKVERRADQLAEAVQTMPEKTANKVIEKIKEGGPASDSDKFPAVRPTGETNL